MSEQTKEPFDWEPLLKDKDFANFDDKVASDAAEWVTQDNDWVALANSVKQTPFKNKDTPVGRIMVGLGFFGLVDRKQLRFKYSKVRASKKLFWVTMIRLWLYEREKEDSSLKLEIGELKEVVERDLAFLYEEIPQTMKRKAASADASTAASSIERRVNTDVSSPDSVIPPDDDDESDTARLVASTPTRSTAGFTAITWIPSSYQTYNGTLVNSVRTEREPKPARKRLKGQ